MVNVNNSHFIFFMQLTLIGKEVMRKELSVLNA